jgi:hypothetical protein
LEFEFVFVRLGLLDQGRGGGAQKESDI